MSISLLQRYFRTFILFAILVLACAPSLSRAADDAGSLIDQFSEARNFGQTEKLVEALAATGDIAVLPALRALSNGDLYYREDDGAVFITRKGSSSRNLVLIDPLTGAEAGERSKRDLEKVKVNNNLRRSIDAAIAGLTLMSPDRTIRLSAARAMMNAPSEDNLALIEEALAAEEDGEIAAALGQARAISILNSSRPIEAKAEAINDIAAIGGRDAISILLSARGSLDPELQDEVDAAQAKIEELPEAKQHAEPQKDARLKNPQQEPKERPLLRPAQQHLLRWQEPLRA